MAMFVNALMMARLDAAPKNQLHESPDDDMGYLIKLASTCLHHRTRPRTLTSQAGINEKSKPKGHQENSHANNDDEDSAFQESSSDDGMNNLVDVLAQVEAKQRERDAANSSFVYMEKMAEELINGCFCTFEPDEKPDCKENNSILSQSHMRRCPSGQVSEQYHRRATMMELAEECGRLMDKKSNISRVRIKQPSQPRNQIRKAVKRRATPEPTGIHIRSPTFVENAVGLCDPPDKATPPHEIHVPVAALVVRRSLDPPGKRIQADANANGTVSQDHHEEHDGISTLSLMLEPVTLFHELPGPLQPPGRRAVDP